MPRGEIHVDDEPVWLLTIKDEDGVAVDISGATEKTAKFEPPGLATISKTPGFYTDGTDGILQYNTETGFLTKGHWRLQGKVVVSGKPYHSDIYSFEVKANL
jgi:hypothetical protein